MGHYWPLFVYFWPFQTKNTDFTIKWLWNYPSSIQYSNTRPLVHQPFSIITRPAIHLCNPNLLKKSCTKLARLNLPNSLDLMSHGKGWTPTTVNKTVRFHSILSTLVKHLLHIFSSLTGGSPSDRGLKGNVGWAVVWHSWQRGCFWYQSTRVWIRSPATFIEQLFTVNCL